jgi:hypothetical protein
MSGGLPVPSLLRRAVRSDQVCAGSRHTLYTDITPVAYCASSLVSPDYEYPDDDATARRPSSPPTAATIPAVAVTLQPPASPAAAHPWVRTQTRA